MVDQPAQQAMPLHRSDSSDNRLQRRLPTGRWRRVAHWRGFVIVVVLLVLVVMALATCDASRTLGHLADGIARSKDPTLFPLVIFE